MCHCTTNATSNFKDDSKKGPIARFGATRDIGLRGGRPAIRRGQQTLELRQRRDRVPGGGRGQFIDGDAPQASDHFGNARKLGRLVAALRFAGIALGLRAVEPVRLDVGRAFCHSI